MSQKEQTSYYPEIWGGIECTIVRLKDKYYDQLESAGHYKRHSDIRHLAKLGIKTIRYPLLWERHQPVRDMEIDWTWADRQLHELRGENIIPIAGLLHHGSGPAFTDLAQPGFAEDLAAYAGLVAARYPWIEYYTPINEPLTTARFSGLYGLWYPHHSDSLSFLTMLLNQVKGIVCSMKAIRQINPAAQLVQTEDLSFTHSSASLSYQADFENQRRWLSYDLLCGKVDETHPLWDYLLNIGIKETDLLFFTGNSCPPDILGLNYYVTSERFLDRELNKYPTSVHGGNSRHKYADVAAVRVTTPIGLLALLEQVWQRYRLPIAITESHLNCTREQQLRWLKETWETACQARSLNIDLRAVTSWALMGAYDWDSLLTVNKGHYESGAYKVQDGQLKLTAVGALIKNLARTGTCHHPLLEMTGWWHMRPKARRKKCGPGRPLLIIGKPASARLWFQTCHDRGILCRLLFSFSSELSLAYWQQLLRRYRPWGLVIVSDTDTASRVLLSEVCKQAGLPCMTWQGPDAPDEASVRDTLDLFIDEVMMQNIPAGQPINTTEYDRK
jgi:dTDP-4-dehydrorhamnose reductase